MCLALGRAAGPAAAATRPPQRPWTLRCSSSLRAAGPRGALLAPQRAAAAPTAGGAQATAKPAANSHPTHQLACGRRRRRAAVAAAAGGGATAGTLTLETVCAELDAILARAVEDRSQEAAARELVERAQAAGQLQAFGRARRLPKRIYTLDELRLNKIEPEKLLAPNDESLNRVRNALQAAAAAGLAAFAYFTGFDFGKVVGLLAGGSFLLVADQVANGGGGEALVVDTAGRLIDSRYGSRVALHEAGHLLVAYLMGVMPKAYTLSSLDAFMRYRALNVQAGTTFCDTAFEAEVAGGRLSSGTLDKYTCVALAGVVTEYLRFGQAEGGVGDVAQLDRLMRALSFSQKKADAEVRWAVLNVAALLRRHPTLQDDLAAAMARGETVGACVAKIEAALRDDPEALVGPEEAGAGASFISSASASASPSSAEASQQEP